MYLYTITHLHPDTKLWTDKRKCSQSKIAKFCLIKKKTFYWSVFKFVQKIKLKLKTLSWTSYISRFKQTVILGFGDISLHRGMGTSVSLSSGGNSSSCLQTSQERQGSDVEFGERQKEKIQGRRDSSANLVFPMQNPMCLQHYPFIGTWCSERG